MENSKLIECECCGGNACYVQQIGEEVFTYFCFGCGRNTSTLMVEGTPLLNQMLEDLPTVFKELMFIDDQKRAWFPSTVTLPEQGMVFLDGTSKENWKWGAVLAVKITKEDKGKFPKGQKFKMDMKNIQHFEKEDFMESLDAISFFGIE